MNLLDGPLNYHRAFRGSVETVVTTSTKHKSLLAVGSQKLNGLWSPEGRLNGLIRAWAGGDDPTDATATIAVVRFPKFVGGAVPAGSQILELDLTFSAAGESGHPLQINDPFTDAPPTGKTYIQASTMTEESGAPPAPGTNFQIVGAAYRPACMFDVLGGGAFHVFVTAATAGIEVHVAIQALANG